MSFLLILMMITFEKGRKPNQPWASDYAVTDGTQIRWEFDGMDCINSSTQIKIQSLHVCTGVVGW
jgi:hypothetical protein